MEYHNNHSKIKGKRIPYNTIYVFAFSARAFGTFTIKCPPSEEKAA
jgi:hypothetical protein